MQRLRLLLLTLIALTASMAAASPPAERACPTPEACGLHQAAAPAGVRIGFIDGHAPGDPRRELVLGEASAYVNHGVSWAAFQPTPGAITGSLDPACEFAETHGLFQLGFHYAWNQVFLDDLAGWVPAITDPQALRDVLRDRVRKIFERCPGIDRLDVVNEPLESITGGALHANHFYQVLGPDYVAELFRLVREEAPDGVELFLNENFIEYFPAKAQGLVALVGALVADGVPIDAVGLQTHLLFGEPDWDLYRRTMRSLAALGVKVFVSELDVPVPPVLADRFQVQAERYRRAAEICLSLPACDALVVWGVDDPSSWLQWFNFFTGPDPAPLLFDGELVAKPAYYALRDVLLRGRGGDHPVAATRLILKRSRGRTSLDLLSSDAATVSPSPASWNDPRVGDPGGARVELFTPAAGIVESVELPAGAAWRVQPRSTRYRAAGRGGGARLTLREGAGVRIRLPDLDLPLHAAVDGLGVRVTLGSLRICARFGPQPARRGGRRWLAAGASADALSDCSLPSAPLATAPSRTRKGSMTPASRGSRARCDEAWRARRQASH